MKYRQYAVFLLLFFVLLGVQAEGSPEAPTDSPPSKPSGSPPQALLTSKGTSLWITLPISVFTLWLLQNLFFPSALDSAGPVATWLASVLPDAIMLPETFGDHGTAKRRFYNWLLGVSAVNEYSACLGFDGENGEAVPKRAKVKKKVKDWFTNSSLGRKFSDKFAFVPIDPAQLAEDQQREARNQRTQPTPTPTPIPTRRSDQLPPPAPLVEPTPLISPYHSFADVEDKEEPLRNRLYRQETEDRYVVLRIARADRSKALLKTIERSKSVLLSEETTSRNILQAEEREMYTGLEGLCLRLLLAAHDRAELGRIVLEEGSAREVLLDAELLEFSSDIRAAARYSVACIVSAPARKQLLHDESQDRMALEDIEHGGIAYLSKRCVLSLCGAQEAESRGRIAEMSVQSLCQIVEDFVPRFLQAIADAEESLRGSIEAECEEALKGIERAFHRSTIEAGEAELRNSELLRGERRERTALSVEHCETLAELKLRSAVEELAKEEDLERLAMVAEWGAGLDGLRFHSQCAALAVNESDARRVVSVLFADTRAHLASASLTALLKICSDRDATRDAHYAAARQAVEDAAQQARSEAEKTEDETRRESLTLFYQTFDAISTWEHERDAIHAGRVYANPPFPLQPPLFTIKDHQNKKEHTNNNFHSNLPLTICHFTPTHPPNIYQIKLTPATGK